MKILQLCKKFPFPLKDGESLAITYLAEALDELGCEVTLLAMNTSKHWIDTSALPPTFDHYQAIHSVRIDNHIRPGAAFLNLFSDRSYHIERFINPDFERRLAEVLKEQTFDIVQLETLYLAAYVPVIRKYSDAKIVLRSHNVEHEIWERIAVNSGFFKRIYLELITPRLKKFEIEHLNRYDMVAGITERDIEHFKRLGLHKPATVTPIGIDSRAYRPDYAAFDRPLSLSFIGSLDWMPNIEGLEWFIQSVWPLLHSSFPGLTLHIAGRNTPDWLRKLRLAGITVHGEVESASDFINRYPLSIAPLLSGGGMRAKILEAMALGRVVLSTQIGMEGIPARHKKEALIADSPAAYVEAIRWCYEQPQRLGEMGKTARSFCAAHFDNISVARRLMEQYRALKEAEQLVY